VTGPIARLALLIAAMLATSCARESAPPLPTADESGVHTVVLLTIDTWRRDATGFLGGLEPSPTPFLDRLASRGLVALDAVAPVPLTGPSHWSMLTGRWPWRDAVRVNGDFPVDPAVPTLARLLRDDGWQTAAFVSAAVLDRRFGFGEGFDVYDDRFLTGGGADDLEFIERRGDETVQAALDWLERQPPGAPLFLWVHLFDPHFPYDSPDGPRAGPRGDYLAEVGFADRQAGRLAAELERRGRPLERSLWVVLSDHGEALGEHGERTHGLLLHGATTRIPLLVAGGGVSHGPYDALASTVDVMPTILAGLGYELPDCDGRSLLTGGEAPGRDVPLESMLGADSHGLAEVVGLRTNEWLFEASPADHLWNLTQDPEERHDVALEQAEVVADLAARRESYETAAAAAPGALDRQTLERLAALGYVRSGAKAGRGDVREFVVDGTGAFDRLISLQRSGSLAEAELLAADLVGRFPDSPLIWLEAGFVAVAMEDLAAAERRFRRATELSPARTKARLNLGNALWLQGRADEAEREYRKVLRRDPGDLFALYNLGALLWEGQRAEEAAEPWRELLQRYPHDPRCQQIRDLLGAGAGAGSR
jgi:arylsulfatase A-like enzyme